MYLGFGISRLWISYADFAGALDVPEEVLTPLSQSKRDLTELLQLRKMGLKFLNPENTKLKVSSHPYILKEYANETM